MPAPCCSSWRRRDGSVKRRLGLLRQHKAFRFTGRVLALAVALLAAAVVSSLTIDLGPWVRGLAESQGSRFLKRPMHIASLKVHVIRGAVELGGLSVEGRSPGDRPF